MNLDFYRAPADLSALGRHAELVENLPRDVGALAKVVQGVMMHEHIAPAYGLTLSAAQHDQAHVRSVEKMLDLIVADDPRPLTEARAAERRLVGVCRQFTLMHAALLRAKGVPARARCGFGAYFQKGRFLDHWVTEYWNEAGRRWTFADAQLDARQRELFNIAFDPLDVPRDRFLVAGGAWKLCRTGKADADAFGILDLHGLWLVAGNLVRDIAALNNREMLAWDCWAPMPRPDGDIDPAPFDRLAAFSREPDRHFDELRAAYQRELGVPATVMNAVRNRLEAV